MTEAMFGLDPKDKRIGIGFFDLGSTNRTEIFQAWPDVYGISQLPYIQAALPVFLMHLRVSIIMVFHVLYKVLIQKGGERLSQDMMPISTGRSQQGQRLLPRRMLKRLLPRMDHGSCQPLVAITPPLEL